MSCVINKINKIKKQKTRITQIYFMPRMLCLDVNIPLTNSHNSFM